MAAPIARHHAEWLQLIEVSGPFLTLPVLTQSFPQGLDPEEPELFKQVRVALDELDAEPGLRITWVRWVLTEVLGWQKDLLRENTQIPSTARHDLPEHRVHLSPDILLTEPGDGKPRLHVCVWPAEQLLDGRAADSSWTASPRERAAELCRATGVPLALVTNGRSWTLVHARAGETVGYATWDAELWLDERLTLRAFRTLLGIERFLGVPDDETLEALLRRSDDAQQEVTDQLGTQVRHAVELLVTELDRADQDAGGELLHELTNHTVYEAAVAVMMRLVFCFFAEEHELLPLSDPRYSDRYAASTLRTQLQEEADQAGEDTLDARTSAWHRLLALFRGVHAGIAHDELRLPAYGGALFDPDRFPFLEGRPLGTTWRTTWARPLPISDRTVLHVLSALQVLTLTGGRGRGEPQRLSYRALDVEQIGHVYEGLLDHDAIRTDSAALGFAGKTEQEIALDLIEHERENLGEDSFVPWLAKQTGLSEGKVAKGLAVEVDALTRSRLRAACGNDEVLAERARPYVALLREDLRELPVVYRAGGIFVTQALDRRSSGSYYTPRALAEEVVRYALEPLVYAPGPAEEVDPTKWLLKSPAEILDLKVCDMAMGSGAFLVGACRYLADLLVESWEHLGDGRFTALGESTDRDPDAAAVPTDAGERQTLARRLVVDRCLYGVDSNPMAVDMAKLSLWLITVAKDRPFSFLDHALRTGDSLLGITSLKQLEFLHLDPVKGNKLHGRLILKPEAIAEAIEDARAKRQEIEVTPVFDPSDADRKAALLEEAELATERLRLLADALLGAVLVNASAGEASLDADLTVLGDAVSAVLAGDAAVTSRIRAAAAVKLRADAPSPTVVRKPFHWPIEFPEVFQSGGFDAVVGNPPFLGGKKVSGALGRAVRDFLVDEIAGGRKGSADVVAYFVLRAASILGLAGGLGLLATNTVAQGETREVALDALCDGGWKIYRAVASAPWPGGAALEVSHLWMRRGDWASGIILDGDAVAAITSALAPQTRVTGRAIRLAEARGGSHLGCLVHGDGFLLSLDEAAEIVSRDPSAAEVVRTYLIGHDVNSRPDMSGSRAVIDFRDWPLERAERWPELVELLRERAKPERDKVKRKAYREHWWRFAEPQMSMRRAVAGFDRAIVIAQTSKTIQPVFAATTGVFSIALVVFAYDDDAHFGLLSSGFHWHWAAAHASTMRTDVRYVPTDCFETFPQCALSEAVAAAGKAVEEWRGPLMLSRNEGLTKTYNRVHDGSEHADDIVELRRRHVELDHAVRDAYGWGDLELKHGFHETKQGIRYTFEPAVTTEVLDRLLELNHARHAHEVSIGLHDKGKKRVARSPQSVSGVQDRLGDW